MNSEQPEQSSADNSASAEQHSSQESLPSTTGAMIGLLGATSAYIFGPMLLFGGIGWWLSERYGSKLYIFVALVIAVIISNILIFRNTSIVAKKVFKQHDRN